MVALFYFNAETEVCCHLCKPSCPPLLYVSTLKCKSAIIFASFLVVGCFLVQLALKCNSTESAIIFAASFDFSTSDYQGSTRAMPQGRIWKLRSRVGLRAVAVACAASTSFMKSSASLLEGKNSASSRHLRITLIYDDDRSQSCTLVL